MRITVRTKGIDDAIFRLKVKSLLLLTVKTSTNGYVHAKYDELWRIVFGTPKRYIQVRLVPPLPPTVTFFDDVIAELPEESAALRAMQADGVTLDSNASRPAEGHLVFMMTDLAVAERHGLHDATEFWDDSPTL